MEGSADVAGQAHSEPRAAVHARKRNALLTGATVLAVFLLYPVLTAFTPVLDGTIGGIGVAYVAGFAEVCLALAIALRHARRGDTHFEA